MKLFLTACLTGLLPALALAQTPPPPIPDATPKAPPFQPIVAADHSGPGRIGVRLAYDKVTGMPSIAALTRGGPAADFGFRVGDVIVKIDKNYTNTLSQDEISLALHGEPGSAVELTVQRDDDPHLLIRSLSRRVLKADTEDMVNPPMSEVAKP